MDWHQVLGILSGLIAISAIIPYARDILRDDAQPNIVSWILWTTIQLIAIWVQLTSINGFSFSIIVLIATTFNTSLVIVLTVRQNWLKKRARQNINLPTAPLFGPIEKICLGLAGVAILIYATAHDPILTLSFDILADIVAAAPTIIKTWRNPYTETKLPWLLITVAAILGAASSTITDLENLALPIYLACMNGLILATILVGQALTPKPRTK